jgi:hypothetical protein
MKEARDLLKCERCAVFLVDLECCEAVIIQIYFVLLYQYTHIDPFSSLSLFFVICDAEKLNHFLKFHFFRQNSWMEKKRRGLCESIKLDILVNWDENFYIRWIVCFCIPYKVFWTFILSLLRIVLRWSSTDAYFNFNWTLFLAPKIINIISIKKKDIY